MPDDLYYGLPILFIMLLIGLGMEFGDRDEGNEE